MRWLLYPDQYKLIRLSRDMEDHRPHVELEHFFAVTYNLDDITIICVEETPVHKGKELSNGWRVLQIKGPFQQENSSLVREIARILRAAEIDIVVSAAFDTDYLLIKQEQLAAALDALESAQYQVDKRHAVSG